MVNDKFSNFDAIQISTIIRVYDKLNIKDHKFWEIAKKRVIPFHPALKGRNFAIFYVELMKRNIPDELRVELTKLLPRELWRFNPDDFTRAFKLVIDNNLLGERLWHNHFHIILWRRTLWLGLRNMPDIIDYLIKIDYLEDTQWWNESFLTALNFYTTRLTDQSIAEKLIPVL